MYVGERGAGGRERRGRERDEREGENERGRKRKEGEKRGEGEREEMRRGEGEEVVHDILSTHGPFYYMGVLACTSSYTSNCRPSHTAFAACMQVTKAV